MSGSITQCSRIYYKRISSFINPLHSRYSIYRLLIVCDVKLLRGISSRDIRYWNALDLLVMLFFYNNLLSFITVYKKKNSSVCIDLCNTNKMFLSLE